MDFVVVILILAVLLAPFLIWGVWTWSTFRKKRIKLFVFQISVTVLGLIYATWKLEIFPGSSLYYDRQHKKEREKYYQALTGLTFTPDTLLFGHYSERDFNGDGYSISIYSIDDKTVSHFQKLDTIAFKNYPIKPDYNEKWESKHWNKSPMKDEERIYLNFALSEFIPTDKVEAQKLHDNFTNIRNIMNSEGAYYAYNYYMHGSGLVGDIDFFIISPADKKIIIINHNT